VVSTAVCFITFQNTDLLDDDDDLFKFVEKKDDVKQTTDATTGAEPTTTTTTETAAAGDDSMLITKYNPSSAEDILSNLYSPTDYSNHIDNVQSDLESLKDLLHNDAYQLDTSQLLGVSDRYCVNALLQNLVRRISEKSLAEVETIVNAYACVSNLTFIFFLLYVHQIPNSKKNIAQLFVNI
jgi:hypothetical protein